MQAHTARQDAWPGRSYGNYTAGLYGNADRRCGASPVDRTAYDYDQRSSDDHPSEAAHAAPSALTAHHHDAWYDEYRSGNEITTAADRKHYAYMQSIGDIDHQTNSCKSGRCLATCIDLLCAMRRGEDISIGGQGMMADTQGLYRNRRVLFGLPYQGDYSAP